MKKRQAGGIGFHQPSDKLCGGDRQLGQRPSGLPEADGIGVSPAPEQKRELRPELFMRQPHASLEAVRDQIVHRYFKLRIPAPLRGKLHQHIGLYVHRRAGLEGAQVR